MFIGQLLKILFFAFMVYMIYYLVRFMFRAGKALHDKRAGDASSSRQGSREGRTRPGSSRGTIELDKDQYKVE
jgi:hypothetical protein